MKKADLKVKPVTVQVDQVKKNDKSKKQSTVKRGDPITVSRPLLISIKKI